MRRQCIDSSFAFRSMWWFCSPRREDKHHSLSTDGISPIILSPMFLVGNPEMRAWCSKKDIPFDEERLHRYDRAPMIWWRHELYWMVATCANEEIWWWWHDDDVCVCAQKKTQQQKRKVTRNRRTQQRHPPWWWWGAWLRSPPVKGNTTWQTTKEQQQTTYYEVDWSGERV